MTNIKERKRTLLTFLLGKPEEQPTLFRQIINKELIKMKEFINSIKDSELYENTSQLNDEIYNSKLKEIENQTKILKEQMTAQSNGIKHPSFISIIDRKLYIIELQLDIGVYNLIQNKNVKFYFDV
jgi:hypothetical protein